MTNSKRTSKSKNTLKKTPAKNSKKALGFDLDLKKIDEVIIGDPKNPGVWLRLMESPSGKRYIQSYSDLTKNWVITSRHNIEENWQSWKETHARIYTKKQRRGPVESKLQVDRPAKNPRRSKRKTGSSDT